MQAVVMHETGGPEVLRLEEADDPEPGEGQVLVRVHAAGVNAIDWKIRSGLRQPKLPKILGSDVSGVIVGSRSEHYAAGDEVFGLAASGSYAELATASGEAIAPKPPELSHAEAAAIPVAGMTAWQALFDVGELQQGEKALIAGATGGVGHFALQFASHAGARPIALGSAHNRELALDLGAGDYVDYTSEDVTEAVRDVDLAFDTVGGDTTAALLATVRGGGHLVTIANSAPAAAAAAREVQAAELVMSPKQEQLVEIAQLLVAGEVRVEIAHELPLSDAARAHELIEAGHTRGKIVLAVAV
jgi:NADPH:quinone reductase-like Zn-dependent oxidoreductase